MGLTSLPWRSWGFGTVLSEPELRFSIFTTSFPFAILIVFLLPARINIQSEPSILANVEKDELAKMDVVSSHVREDDTAEADASSLSNKESAGSTGLYHTSTVPPEGDPESSIDYLSQSSPIFGSTTTHGGETPTSSYGSELAEIFAQIFAQAIPVRLPKRTLQPPEIKITGPRPSSPQSSHTAPLRSRKGTSISCTECRRRKQKVLLVLFSVKSIKIKDVNSATNQKMAHATIVRDVTLQ
jgi:hypothetical protein